MAKVETNKEQPGNVLRLQEAADVVAKLAMEFALDTGTPNGITVTDTLPIHGSELPVTDVKFSGYSDKGKFADWLKARRKPARVTVGIDAEFAADGPREIKVRHSRAGYGDYETEIAHSDGTCTAKVFEKNGKFFAPACRFGDRVAFSKEIVPDDVRAALSEFEAMTTRGDEWYVFRDGKYVRTERVSDTADSSDARVSRIMAPHMEYVGGEDTQALMRVENARLAVRDALRHGDRMADAIRAALRAPYGSSEEREAFLRANEACQTFRGI